MFLVFELKSVSLFHADLYRAVVLIVGREGVLLEELDIESECEAEERKCDIE